MPWQWRPQRYWRRRRTWRRRFRGPFRPRLWRRRYYRRHTVRKRKLKRKLKFLPLKEWQPKYIRKLKITGILPLFMTTNERVCNNGGLYFDSIAPHYVPSGGGWSVTIFTLNAFWELFKKARCWWTQSNDDFPLIRYLYCKIYLYRAESADYIVNYHVCPPMKATLETYQSTQPQLMQLNKHHRIIPCKKHNYRKKPYQVLKINPPSTLKNKWYFQKELCNTPLLMLMASSMSLDRFYMGSSSISNTVGFYGLNTSFFQLHNFKQKTTDGYKPKENTYLYSYSDNTTNWQSVTLSKLIYLGNSFKLQLGQPIGTQWNDYTSKYDSWGNIFHPDYLTGSRIVLSSLHSLPSLKQLYESTLTTTTLSTANISPVAESLLVEYRYNPLNDRSNNNEIFVDQILTAKPNWSPPTDPTQKTENLPLWLGLWGFADWQKRQGIQQLDTNNIIVLHTDYIDPKRTPYIVPIDDDMLQGRSPFRPAQNVTPFDRENWHPKFAFQQRTLNEICAAGPAVIKLPPNVSAEAHIKFVFYFKLGGCAQPAKNIENPEDQPIFPTPGNLLQSTSLQSPETPIQNFIYSFDWRRSMFTKAAQKRIEQHCLSEKALLEPTGLSLFNAEASTETTPTENTQEEKKEEQALQQLILQQRHHQQKFRRRILQLLMDQTLE
nr:MAG: ORF1 [TTV-like mini virus]